MGGGRGGGWEEVEVHDGEQHDIVPSKSVGVNLFSCGFGTSWALQLGRHNHGAADSAAAILFQKLPAICISTAGN